MKKKRVAIGVGLLATSLLSLSVDHKAEAAAYQLTGVTGPKTCAPGSKFQIKLTGHVLGGSDVLINPSANGYTFDASFVYYPELNYIHVDKDGYVTVAPNTKGGIRETIMIHLPDGSNTSFNFLVKIPGQLSDIAGSYAKDAIYRLAQNRAVSGVGDGSFHPHQVINHEEFATMLKRSEQDDFRPITTSIQATNYPKYSDNQNPKAWYYPYIQNNQYIPPLVSVKGDDRPQEVFGVGKPISRQDAIDAIMQTFLSGDVNRIMHETDPKKMINWDAFQPFTDLGTNSPYYDSITAAKYLGIVSGYGDGKLHPNDSITREMAAQLIDQALQKLVSSQASQFQMVYGYEPFLNSPNVNR